MPWLRLAAIGLLLHGCGREEPATVVLDPATGKPVASAPAAMAPAEIPPVAVAASAPVAPQAQAPTASAAPEPAPPLPTPPPAPAAAAPPAPSLSEGAALLAARPLLMPVEGVPPQALQDTYAQGRGKRSHEAIDIMAPRGTRVFAVDDGKLVKLFTSVPGGLTVYQFDPQGQLAYYYAHLDRYAEGLKEGMALRRGDLVGYVGSTGNASPEGPHLHFAVFRLGRERRWWQGEPVNPYPALRNAAPLAKP